MGATKLLAASAMMAVLTLAGCTSPDKKPVQPNTVTRGPGPGAPGPIAPNPYAPVPPYGATGMPPYNQYAPRPGVAPNYGAGSTGAQPFPTGAYDSRLTTPTN